MPEVTASTQILVVGGGAAGVAAAVGAAQAGAEVILLERYGFLGGLATTALVGTVCGLYLRQEGPPAWAHAGFPRVFGERLQQASGTQVATWRDGLRFLPYEPLAFRGLCDDLLHEHGVTPWLHTTVSGVEVADGRLRSLDAIAWDRLARVEAQAVIDCSGQSLVTALAAGTLAPTERGQAPAIGFALTGLEEVPTFNLRMATLQAMRRAIDTRELPHHAESLSIVPGTHRGSRARFKLGLRQRVQATPGEASALELLARSTVRQVLRVLRRDVDIYRHAVPVDVATQIGIRTGRRAVGVGTLTDAHVLEARHHPEGIANGAWPVEEWGEDSRPSLTPFAEGQSYQIPSDTLSSASFDNLWFAGRHLSAEDMAIASARVIGTCLATGWAAGTLAGHAVQGRTRAAALSEIRRAQVLL